MTEHVQARTEQMILDFDGRVLEIFGNAGSRRALASELTYSRSNADKKGRVSVTFHTLGGTILMFVLEAQDVADIDAFLAALEQAGVQKAE